MMLLLPYYTFTYIIQIFSIFLYINEYSFQKCDPKSTLETFRFELKQPNFAPLITKDVPFLQ